ncbi:MAG TPA: sigma-54 dependent transcriptional regulator [Deltaproteobacteria bacterium]|jgi:two-component system response regulator FlrC|nr:sigma-54 dependent transcriptional regulator [Deltaproteobacteria bacterium]HOI08264.1 sigma-54 dependent transcriptional regulator [Deltaproteobacteria bacterium]
MGIAILDPDKSTVTILADLIDEMGETPQPFTDKDKFLGAINPKAHSIAIISDDFLDVIEGTKQVYQSIDIVATGVNGSDPCILAGAAHYLKKPFRADDFRQVLNALLGSTKGPGPSAGSFIAADPGMKKIIEVLNKVSPTSAPVFIQGESGTGKEVVARYIHRMSKRANGPYVGINLAAIPDTLLESELFGYEKGAFTGAYATRVGKFELAHGGTILLDEVTEISGGMQAKLLRVLQERQIDRVGSKAPISVDFRVIATTNRDIEHDIREGSFRRDLYFRLNVIPIKIPPLRSRREDIIPLASHFIAKIAQREGMSEKSLTPGARDALLSYSWPGNVRELENAIERAMILTDGPSIPADSVTLGMEETQESFQPALAAGTTIHEMEKNLIMSTLQSVDGNRTRAATLLGISIRTLRNKLNEYSGNGQFSDADPAGSGGEE